MTDSRFLFTDRVRPLVELGVGDTRIDTGIGRWDTSHWDDTEDATWASSPYWLDISCHVIDATVEIGRPRATDRFIVGTCALAALNLTGWADMTGPGTEPAMTEVRPGRALRIGIEHVTLGTRWLWRGVIDAVTPVYESADLDVVYIDAIDALGEAGRVPLARLAAPVGSGETGGLRVKRILDAAKWPAAQRVIESTGVTMLATDLGAPCADLLTVVAESVGGAVYGDTEGRVVFRGRDWQTFEPADPVDGTIGNVGAVGEACPTGWEYSSQRIDIVTQVIIGRTTDTAPTTYDDATGQALYGIETWQATDLICAQAYQLTRLAQRQFRTRGYTATPRVERVHLDASTSDAVVDLASTVDIYAPSRYRCVLQLPRGSVFDADMFATGVRHTIRPESWTVDIDLDFAAPWEATAGRWDEDFWDLAAWSGLTRERVA